VIPAKFINEKLEDFSYRLEDAWTAICDWLTEDWWFIPLLAFAVIVLIAWLLTGGTNHFHEWPFS
jgi:hypothetical protein